MADKKSADDSQKMASNLERAAAQATLYRDAIGETADLSQQLLRDESKILQAADQRLDIAQTERDLAREMVEVEKQLAKKSTKKLRDHKKSLDLNQDLLMSMKAQNKKMQNIRKTLGNVNDQMAGLVDGAKSFIGALPGGSALNKLLGFDELTDGLTASFNAAGAAMMQDGTGIKDGITAFSKAAGGLISPFTIIAGIVAGLVAVFINFEKRAKGVAEATGLTLSQSKSLVKEAKAASQSKSVELATSTDILEVQKATVKEFGIANMLSASQAANVADIGRSFGIGAAKAAEVTNEFMRMGMGGAEAANELQNVSAEALKAGVSVGAVTADIAANAKDVAKYFGGNVKALRKAAVEAAKLGVSLATMAKVSDGLLSFEESIASQFEFQAMTGKMINFDKARQLALDGKIAEATQEVLSNVGSLAEFDAMRPMAQRKLAQATGMTVSELTKSLAIQEKLTNATEAEAAAAMGLGLSAAEIASKSPEQLKTLLAQQEASGQIAKDFAAMKDDISAALIPMGQVLLTIFSGISTVVGYIVDGFKTLAPVLAGIGVIMAALNAQLVYAAIATMIQNAFKTFSGVPFVGYGLGIAAALAGVGFIKSKVQSAGDVSIDPNGGPVVMSPKEGGLFQGTKNDGVSMSPSHGAGGGGGNVAAAIAQTNALLRQILETGTVLELDGQLVGKTLRTSDSFRRR
eukprot:GHVU01125647.1.p1 GENE.GHVU01125647.1~~GHVU01125647.1.p1  ORF type:complete len:692 (-),score=81.56 GHVU01125647.1:832-2907(-)